MKMIKALSVISVAVLSLSLMGCAPKVGSEAWCESMKEKPKGDWSTNDASAYAEHCIFK
ncbi:DUF3012 domain-containing protein [Aestuariicella sp. G3-2]|uniref:DUF3012 domain-containing protein n=1 Tax=Pseudomaricurvus albidus TaxID=2842452 RepID=UPI001C0A9D5D|nr:DUF3012 domain-containing protein [Aestuariicella albida]MBU3070035.1 DUF3012 domain-containing protein [Aestuariicella albida]